MNQTTTIRTDWNIEEITAIYHQPLLELVYQAATVHRQWHQPSRVQVCTLLSVKTGGCTEDCSYCGQAARYHTDIKVKALMSAEEVISCAKRAKEAGSSRFCMAAAWRKVRDNKDFDRLQRRASWMSLFQFFIYSRSKTIKYRLINGMSS